MKDDHQFVYEIFLEETPSRLGIWHEKITELYLYDENDNKIAEYCRKWIIEPKKRTDAYELVGILIRENRKKGTRFS